MNTRSSPSLRSRLLALVVGPVYLLIVAQALSAVTQTSYAVTVALTAVGSLAIMTVLVVFGVKAYRYKHSTIRFTLSSAFLISIPLSLYLGTLRWVFRALLTHDVEPNFLLWISPFAVLFMVVTTAILLCLAEAIIWLALAVLRPRPGRRRVNRLDKLQD